jgi:hypothetical protein
MKYLMLALCLFAATSATAQTAPTELVPQKPDERALMIIRTLLAKDIAEASRFSNAEPTILSTWAKVSVSEPPYLFAKLVDSYHCGNVNCELYGFQPIQAGWRKVFAGSGWQWHVLESAQNGHQDLSKTMHGGANNQETTVYRWIDGRYRRVSNHSPPERPLP